MKIINTTTICGFFMLFMISCNSKDTPASPCNNTGTICFTNKTDSIVVVNIKEAPAHFSLAPDFLQCIAVKGNVLYTINMSGKNYYKDTTFVLQVCDKKTINILR